MTELRDEIVAAFKEMQKPINEKMIDVLEAIVIAKRIKQSNMEHMEMILVKTRDAHSLAAKSIDLLNEVDKDLNDFTPEEFKDANIQSKLQDILGTLDYLVEDDHNDKYSCEYCVEKRAQKLMNKLSEHSRA